MRHAAGYPVGQLQARNDMREKLMFVHRWLGLTAGVIFAIASATGAVLIYQADLDRLIGIVVQLHDRTLGTREVDHAGAS